VVHLSKCKQSGRQICIQMSYLWYAYLSGYYYTNLIEIKLLILLYNIFIYTFIFSNNEFEDKYISQYGNNPSNSVTG
jgi:hypothetical protein